MLCVLVTVARDPQSRRSHVVGPMWQVWNGYDAWKESPWRRTSPFTRYEDIQFL